MKTTLLAILAFSALAPALSARDIYDPLARKKQAPKDGSPFFAPQRTPAEILRIERPSSRRGASSYDIADPHKAPSGFKEPRWFSGDLNSSLNSRASSGRKPRYKTE